MGSTQRNIMLSNSAKDKLGGSFYANIKVHQENPRSKFINALESAKPHKSSKAKKATKKKRRK